MTGVPLSPPPLTRPTPIELPAYVSSGVVGLRVPRFAMPTRAHPATAVVGGFVESHPVHKVEAEAYVPYPLALDVRVGPWWASQRPDLLAFTCQSYDFATAELTTRFQFQSGPATAELEVSTFACRSLPHLVCQDVRLRVDRPTRLQLKCGIDTTDVPGDVRARHVWSSGSNHVQADGFLRWASRCGSSSVGLAFFSTLDASDGPTPDRKTDSWGDASPILTTYHVAAEPGRTYTLRQISAVVPSLAHGQPELQAVRLAFLGTERTSDGLRAEHRAAWAELWRGRVRLVGADESWQRLADANFFYANTSVHPSAVASTGLFGQAKFHDYHYFNGHQFWDVETFLLPPVLLSQPHAAKALLAYRGERLPAARRHAAMLGYRGAMFPWESAPTSGEESTPVDYAHVVHEQHVSLDVAVAMGQYVDATGDVAFARRHAWPVLEAVAEWVVSRVTRTARGCELRTMTGIREHRHPVHNNAWVNAGAIATLRAATALGRRLGMDPPTAWERVADRMYMPVDPATHALLAHDDFDVASRQTNGEAACAFFPLRWTPNDPTVLSATVEHWRRHVRSEMGMPMIPPLAAGFAARTGDRVLVGEMLQTGCADYLFGPFATVDEFGRHMTTDKPKVGPYLAHAGAFLQSVLFGLCGLQLGAGDPSTAWPAFPVVMPEAWDGVEVDRVWARGRAYRLSATHGAKRATFDSLDEGEGD